MPISIPFGRAIRDGPIGSILGKSPHCIYIVLLHLLKWKLEDGDCTISHRLQLVAVLATVEWNLH